MMLSKICATGANIYGQWINEDLILKDFTFMCDNQGNFCIQKSKLILISWSYNIFHYDDKYYMIGFVFSAENQCKEILMPDKDIRNIIIVGDEYKLYVVSQTTNDFWVLDLNIAETWVWEHKQLLPNNVYPKESKIESVDKNTVIKAGMTVHALIILYSNGDVYEWPNRIKTHHCNGKVVDFVTGYEHIVLLTDTGELYSFGNGRRCQLGLGNLICTNEPTLINALAGIQITKIAAAGWHNLAVSEFGDLYAWGSNEVGQLGIVDKDEDSVISDKHIKHYAEPTLVQFYDEEKEEIDVNTTQISCGSRHSAVLSADNCIYTTGLNSYGQLGFCEIQCEMLTGFKKAYKCDAGSKLECGPWSTAVY